MNVQPVTPAHAASAPTADFDMFAVKAEGGDYQRAILDVMKIGPVFWTARNGGHWVLTQSDDIDAVLNNPDVFSASKMFVPREKNPTPPLTPLMIDPPDHTQFRRMIAPAFTPKATAALGERARATARALVADIAPQKQCEFVHAFAERLPIDVFMHMVDLPASDRDHLMQIGEHHVRPPTPQHHIDSMMQLQAYALQKIKERRANPGGDLISELTQQKFDGRALDDTTLVGMVVLLLVAGLDTVSAQLGFFAKFLADHDDHRRQLAADPTLVPKAVEELMRRFAIVTVGRILTRDHAMHGTQMKAGDMIIMPLFCMSADDRRFPRPMDIDFNRPFAPLGAFGRGVHQCVGSMLARAELRVFIEEWLKVIPDFKVAPGAEIAVSSGTVTGLRRLPLAW